MTFILDPILNQQLALLYPQRMVWDNLRLVFAFTICAAWQDVPHQFEATNLLVRRLDALPVEGDLVADAHHGAIQHPHILLTVAAAQVVAILLEGAEEAQR